MNNDDKELRHEIWEDLPTCGTPTCNWPDICNVCSGSISNILSTVQAFYEQRGNKKLLEFQSRFREADPEIVRITDEHLDELF